MSLVGSESNRSVVPRWRVSSSFDQSPESSAVSLREGDIAPMDSSFYRTLQEWREGRTAGLLADLFSIAVVENRSEHLSELANEVMKLGDKIPLGLQRMALALVSDADPSKPVVADWLDVADSAVVSGYISSLKAKAISSPSNGFVWNDLAYAYNLIGERGKAEKAMAVALKVSSSHRLIARGASRLYLHQADPEKALDVLKRAQGFSRDPWLLSAHLAIAQASRTSSGSIDVAKRALERIGSGRQQSSELGMALATEEMWNGKLKRAKLIAREASAHATENALAQAVWMSPRLHAEVVNNDAVESATDAHEAKSWGSYYKGEWAKSVHHVVMWLRDEPYSVVPALQGSFVSATFMNDYALSQSLAEFGLRHNPDSWSLRNNLVVALAVNGDSVRAHSEFQKLTEPGAGTHDHAVWMATEGLLSYRAGNIERARSLYLAAREAFEKANDRMSQLTLAVYQSIEEAYIGNGAEAERLVRGVLKKLGIRSEAVSIVDVLGSEVVKNRKDG